MELKQVIIQRLREMATGSAGRPPLKCLGLAYSEVAEPLSERDLKDPLQFSQLESRLTFVALVGLLDPPRPEARAALRKCQGADIRVMVVTGENKDTAEALCRQIGILDKNESSKGVERRRVEGPGLCCPSGCPTLCQRFVALCPRSLGAQSQGYEGAGV